MNIRELLNSSYRVGSERSNSRRQPSYVFSQKPFGSVYAFNKTVQYKYNASIVEITVYITTATELDKTAHKVSIALQGLKNEEYTSETLIAKIREKRSVYREASAEEILSKVLTEKNMIYGKYIMQSENDPDKFLVVDKKISLNTNIRVKCSCFSGDTEVLLGDGTYRTLKELDGETNFSIVAYNGLNNKFEIARATKCELKKKDSKLLKVTLSDGTVIKSTEAHRFLKSNNEWVIAADLKKGTFLKSISSSKQELNNYVSKESYYTYVYLDPRNKGNFVYDDLELEYEPFYVGVGSGIIKDIDNSKCYTRMSDIYEDGYNPILVKQEIRIDKRVALQVKDRLVKNIGIESDGTGPLVNRKVIDEVIDEVEDLYFVTDVEECSEVEDVYCITTEGLGNFILKTKEDSSGIVVENCSDYYYTFAYYNADHKVHIGQHPPKYVSRRASREGSFTPVRNPGRLPGACKHLMLFLALLMTGNVLDSDENTSEAEKSLLKSYTDKANKKRIKIYSRRDITAMVQKVEKELRADNIKRRRG